MLSSEEECFIVRSLSSLASKCLKLGGERFDRILRLANKTSVIDPRVSDTSPSEPCSELQYFPTLTDTELEEPRFWNGSRRFHTQITTCVSVMGVWKAQGSGS